MEPLLLSLAVKPHPLPWTGPHPFHQAQHQLVQPALVGEERERALEQVKMETPPSGYPEMQEHL